MNNCLCCASASGIVDARRVDQDDRVTAFLDIQSTNPQRVLVIPNRHAALFADLDPDASAHRCRVGQRRASAVRQRGLPCEGVTLFLAAGEAMQNVLHVPLLVFPRYTTNGFGLSVDSSSGQRQRGLR